MSHPTTITFEVSDGIGWVRMNRPERRNAFDQDLRGDLMQVLETVRQRLDIRVLVLCGSPGAFCAGGNLNVLRDHLDAGPAYWQQRLKTGLRFITDMQNLRVPVIAVVDGPAMGAGFALALTADIVLASPRARFSMAYLRLGVMPDLGVLYLLPRAVGLQRARELSFSTRELGAEEARQIGLVLEVHESEQLDDRAREIARSMAQAAPVAVAMTKSLLNASLDTDMQTHFSLEANAQSAVFSTPEPRQAVEALLARQSPPYTGFNKVTG